VKVVLDGLIDVLEDPRDGVREIAPTALANLGPGARPAIPRLMKLLGDTSNEARMRAAIAILRIQPHHPKLAATAPALVELLKSSPCADEDSEKDARKALEYIGAPALPLLIQAVLEKAATRREHKAQIDQLVQEELKKNGLNDHQDPTADKPSE
jgi:HEAT repeat protein